VILYEKDWADYPTARPHYATTNKTWVRLAGVYNKMGVSNCMSHLALINPALEHVDPHSPDLDKATIMMIVEEIAENPWYALREIIRVPAVAGVNTLPLRANRGNIALYWLFFNHITTLLIQPRQTGKSVSVDSLSISLLTMICANTDITLLTKDDGLRVKNVARLKGIMESLPSYMQLRVRGDSNNTEKLTINGLGNTYVTAVSQASAKAALKLGRGFTTPIIHVDELAFIQNLETTLPALLAGSVAARDSAAAAGAPYGILFTTTPGYLASPDGKYAYKVYEDSFSWSEKLMDCANLEDLESHIRKNNSSRKLQVVLDYNHRQLGYTDEWLRRKIEETMATGDSAKADFLNVWPEGNASSLIPKDKLAIMIDNKRPETEVMVTTYGYILRLYVPLEDLCNYHIVAGLDTSDAVGKDGIGLILRDVYTGKVLGVGDFNETNTVTFARWLSEFLIAFPKVTLIIERKSTGVSIIDALIELLLHAGIDPFARLFNWVVNDSRTNLEYAKHVTGKPFRSRDRSVYTKYRKHFGYATSASGRSSRDMLYGEIFNSSVRYTSDTIMDNKLINQLSGLIVKNNRVDHASGEHDDLVIGWLLGYWMLAKGENMDFYGIPQSRILSNVAESKVAEDGGIEAIEAKEFQLELKEEIDDVVAQIANTRSYLKAGALINKLKYLYRDIDTTIIQSFNMESLLESLELEKNRKRFKRY